MGGREVWPKRMENRGLREKCSRLASFPGVRMNGEWMVTVMYLTHAYGSRGNFKTLAPKHDSTRHNLQIRTDTGPLTPCTHRCAMKKQGNDQNPNAAKTRNSVWISAEIP